MRKAEVYRNEHFAGELAELNANQYQFTYDANYLLDENLPAVSLTLPKSQAVHRNDHLFPFFFNLLSEGVNRQLQCRHFRIDENDDFGLLVATARYDTIGAVTVRPLPNQD